MELTYNTYFFQKHLFQGKQEYAGYENVKVTTSFYDKCLPVITWNKKHASKQAGAKVEGGEGQEVSPALFLEIGKKCPDYCHLWAKFLI